MTPKLGPNKTRAYVLFGALFLFLLAVYLLTYTPRINSSDGLAMFSTAESLVRRGALDIEQVRWLDLQQGTYGLDGLLYSRKGIGVPVGLLPLTWLGLVVPWFGTVSVSLLFNAVVTALTGVVLLTYLFELGFSQRTGLIVAPTFGLATLAWTYAKSLFSDPLAGLLLLTAAYFLLKFRHSLTNSGAEAQERKGEDTITSARLLPCSSACLSYPFLAGLLLGWNVVTRYAEALFLPVYGLLLLYYLWKTSQENDKSGLAQYWPPILAFGAPMLLIGLGLIAFNISRYGDPFNTGYLPNETFSAVWWQGITGQLISPGRGLLLYCPIFLLGFGGIPSFLRRFRAEAILALSVIVIHLLLYGKWFMWHGGFAWGPRFMVPTLPFWALFLAPVAKKAFPATKKTDGYVLRAVYIILVILGLIPQLLTVTVDFTPFQGWLLDTGLPLFDSQTFFDPQYSPLLYGWDFIDRNNLDLAWAWQGRFNGWLLAMLLINLGLTGLFLWQASRSSSRPAEVAATRRVGLLALVSTAMSLILLFSYTHTLPDQSLQDTISALNEAVRPEDAVIINDPDITMPFAELYQGRASVLGLNNGGFPLPEDINRRLQEITAGHPQVWWLPNWLPPEQSAIEQTLLTTGFRARNGSFEERRLSLFAFPSKLPTQMINATFANLIALVKIAYPPHSEPGTALPIELTWQGQAPSSEDYHVFLHLLDSTGNIVTQADGQPALWTRPTSAWAVGETVLDRHGLWIPPATPLGTYQLRVGLYRPADGQRLTLPDGADAVALEVTIQ